MKLIHALWIPEDSHSKSGLFIWAETIPLPRTKEKINTKQKHPFIVKEKDLRESLLQLIQNETNKEIDDYKLIIKNGDWHKVSLLLPTKNNIPQISPELAHFYDNKDEGKQEFGLKQWEIEGLIIPVEYLQEFILSINIEEQFHGIIISNDFIFWSICLKFSLELTARQRFIPSIINKGNFYYGKWVPVYDNPKDNQKLLSLVKSMPPVCRSIVTSETNINVGVNGRELVENFISSFIDCICRKGILSKQEYFRNKLSSDTPTEMWIKSLFFDEPKIKSEKTKDVKSIENLKLKLEEWTNKRKITKSPFRTSFRLETYEQKEEENLKEKWRLSFFLQAVDEPSLLIPFIEVWGQRKKSTMFFNRKLEHPQEHILSDLGFAVNLFNPLEKSLKKKTPELCDLTTEEVYYFLKEASILLEESGFGVLIPSWLESANTRIGIVLNVSQPESPTISGAGLFGMDSVFNFNWQMAIGNNLLTEEEFEQLAEAKVPLVKIRGQWVEFKKEELEKTLKLWKSRDQITLSELLRINAINSNKGFPVMQINYSGELKKLFSNMLANEKIEEISTPKNFNGVLRPYQAKGISWLEFMLRYGFGPCLADDMGLGKTIQVIAYLLHKKQKDRVNKPSLLICPTSIVGNWEREIKRFAPEMKVMIHHGSERLKDSNFIINSKNHDIVISTYSLANRDQSYITSLKWSFVVLDEAQNIKNPYAKQTLSILKIKADNKIALTGTPVENRLSELWSILNFLNPGFLGTWLEFRTNFAIPIEKYQDKDLSEKLKNLVRPFILRRLKTDKDIIKDLPEKQEIKVYCSLTKEQATLYQAVVNTAMSEIEDSEGIKRKGIILSTLTKLKQICNHPAHFLKDRSSISERSGKLNRLTEMLDEVFQNNEKCLIFTQFKEMGDILKQYLQEYSNKEILFMHGSIDRKNRESIIKKFQEEQESKAFILSLKAGGLGLNLTAANHVFHFDRWWNPAVENQATDRTFRIGQKKNVFVYKFICAGTVEEKIDAIIEKKKALAESVIVTGERWLTELSTEELKDVFTLRIEEIGDV